MSRQSILHRRCAASGATLSGAKPLVHLFPTCSKVHGAALIKSGSAAAAAPACSQLCSRGLLNPPRPVRMTHCRAVESPPQLSTSEQVLPSQQVDWFDAWYPVAYEVDVAKETPYRMEFMGMHIVIWWNPNASAWTVFEDICPHRLVPLSEGRINGRGNLECGYHGWEFSGTGACERIPQGGNNSSPRACARAFPCVVRQGLLFVKPKALPNAALAQPGSDQALAAAAEVAADAARIPIVPELEDPEWVAQDTWRDLPYGFETLMENVMDVSHVPFTHHKSISNRNMIGDFKLTLDAPIQAHGFSGNWPTGPRAGKLGPQSTEFIAPCYMKHKLDGQSIGFQALTVVYVVPMRPGQCRLINRNCQRLLKARALSGLLRIMPRWLGHVGSHVPLEDDQIFLHLGEPTTMQRRIAGQPISRAYYMASPADNLVAAFHKWLDTHAGRGPFGPATQAMLEAIGPRLDRDALLDRYSSHTAQCATCQKGLRQVRAAMLTANIVKVAAAGLALFTAAVAVNLSLMAGLPAAAAAPPAASQGLAGWLLSAARWLALGGSQVAGAAVLEQQVLRVVAWVALAAIASLVVGRLQKLEAKFFKGDYPPMRNTAKDGP